MGVIIGEVGETREEKKEWRRTGVGATERYGHTKGRCKKETVKRRQGQEKLSQVEDKKKGNEKTITKANSSGR